VEPVLALLAVVPEILVVVEVEFHSPNHVVVVPALLELVVVLVALVVPDLYMELNLLVVVVLMEFYHLVLVLEMEVIL
jgi:hypothetical protein